jgi:hypothetical protein
LESIDIPLLLVKMYLKDVQVKKWYNKFIQQVHTINYFYESIFILYGHSYSYLAIFFA